MKHYLDDNGFTPDLDIPEEIADKFLTTFVHTNVKEDGKVDMERVLDNIFAAERTQYEVMYHYGICETLQGVGGRPSAESIFEGDETKTFILNMFKFFISKDYIHEEFPLFFHHTLMVLAINLYDFKD